MTSDKPQTSGCYAAKIGDCSGSLSREHSTSDTVLKEIDQGDGVEVSGMSWIAPGTTRRLAPSALASRVLCKGHNSYLGKYDTVGKRAFSAIGAAIRMAHRAEVALPTEQVDANLFAGWILKSFCGHAASAQLMDPGGKRVKATIEDEWLQVLFGREPWPIHWATTVVNSKSSPIYTKGGGYEISPLHSRRQVDKIEAIEVILHGIKFVLFLSKAPAILEGAPVFTCPLRLAFISMRNQETTSIDFVAQSQASPQTIVEFHLTGIEHPG